MCGCQRDMVCGPGSGGVGGGGGSLMVSLPVVVLGWARRAVSNTAAVAGGEQQLGSGRLVFPGERTLLYLVEAGLQAVQCSAVQDSPSCLCFKGLSIEQSGSQSVPQFHLDSGERARPTRGQRPLRRALPLAPSRQQFLSDGR